MRISIIVPIYNVEPYLRKCVDSLLSQDIPSDEYEIILVDDGSPDNCGAICDEYAALCANIKVIHQENGGLSVARNSGVAVAQGNYIQFVDSDDFLQANVLGTLLQQAENYDLDVLRFNYQNVNEQYQVFEPYKQYRPYVDYSESVCDGLTFLNERLGYACYACQFLIRSSIAREVLFKPDILFEDTQWTPRMLCSCKRVASKNLVAYNYLVRVGSITKSDTIDKHRRIADNQIRLLDDLRSQMLLVKDQRWHKGMISSTTIALISLLSTKLYKEHTKYISELKTIVDFPISYYHLSVTGLKKARIINISPKLACLLIHTKNRRCAV